MWINIRKFLHPLKNVPNHYPENYPQKEKILCTDKDILENSYLLVSNTFPGFHALGEQNCLLQVKAFIRSKQFCSPSQGNPRNVLLKLKVSISQKQIMASWILPKNERSGIFQYIKLPQRSFFGRIQDNIYFSRFSDL